MRIAMGEVLEITTAVFLSMLLCVAAFAFFLLLCLSMLGVVAVSVVVVEAVAWLPSYATLKLASPYWIQNLCLMWGLGFHALLVAMAVVWIFRHEDEEV